VFSPGKIKIIIHKTILIFLKQQKLSVLFVSIIMHLCKNQQLMYYEDFRNILEILKGLLRKIIREDLELEPNDFIII